MSEELHAIAKNACVQLSAKIMRTSFVVANDVPEEYLYTHYLQLLIMSRRTFEELHMQLLMSMSTLQFISSS